MMAISEELRSQILRYHHVEKWRVGTICTQLNVHHTTVKRVLSETGVSKDKVLAEPTMIEPYLPFIQRTLEKYPHLTASRLYGMVRERAYPGGPDHFRHMISLYRPKRVPEAYLRLRTLPAEQAQVDWGHFDYVTIGKARRPLMAFVMVLSYSRKVFLRFYLNQRTDNFLRGHEAAFAHWDGVPKMLLYDNLKSAVLERQGDAIRFNPILLEFAAHFRFEPRPVAVARGNEKGRVERAIRYIRSNFFAGREWSDVDDLNAQAQAWCDGYASERPCPEDKSKSVHDVFLEEQPQLIDLPEFGYSTEERETVRVGKTPYVRFDWNDYSVPHTYTRCALDVVADLERVMVFDGSEKIAEHKRSFDKAQQIEEKHHIDTLVEYKRHAKHHQGQNRLSHALSNGHEFLVQAAKHNYVLATITKQMLRLLDEYGAAELEEGIKEALEKQVPHPNSVRLALEKRREKNQEPPPIPVTLPDDARVRELSIRPHSLNDYDALQSDEMDVDTDAKEAETETENKTEMTLS